VCQPAAGSIGRFGAHFFFFNLKRAISRYCEQQAATSDPASSNPPLLSAYVGLSLDEQHCPLRTYHGVFFSRAEKPCDEITNSFFMNVKWF
jgi:hypothetical protein